MSKPAKIKEAVVRGRVPIEIKARVGRAAAQVFKGESEWLRDALLNYLATEEPKFNLPPLPPEQFADWLPKKKPRPKKSAPRGDSTHLLNDETKIYRAAKK